MISDEGRREGGGEKGVLEEGKGVKCVFERWGGEGVSVGVKEEWRGKMGS